jgi:antitoxin (DNA-binding transcriptional repressor) of toxin-antitoxin stability system
MHILAFSELFANLTAVIDLVERGETVRIVRHGKVVADLVPPRCDVDKARMPSWKRPFVPVVLPGGVTLSQAVLDERMALPW